MNTEKHGGEAPGARCWVLGTQNDELRTMNSGILNRASAASFQLSPVLTGKN